MPLRPRVSSAILYFPPILGLLLIVFSLPALSTVHEASSETELRQALEDLNSNGGTGFIDIRDDITLTESLPPVLASMTIRGNGHRIQGASAHRIFVLGSAEAGTGPRILASIRDLELIGGAARGGDGADGGGGGMGAGGAVQVNARADVVLDNVSVYDSAASGGDGAAGSGGGGGGQGGDGGTGDGGGGGGLFGEGGTGGMHGGGGGALASGGDAADGGGGGGGLGSGGDGDSAAGEAGAWAPPWLAGSGGSGEEGAAGGESGGGGGAGASGGAGGGGGFGGADGTAGHGGSGGYLGGGGGAGTSGSGGSGGFGGGGGGAMDGPGGSGGHAGGGGGSASGAGGDGGYGGGGGSGATGGDGGFGGGGGAGATPGGGGVGGGDGGQDGGGGGAGLGGGIFVSEGGGLTLSGNTRINGNAVGAGSGAFDGAHGREAGSGLFLEGSGVLTLRGSASGTPMEIEDDIADAFGAGLEGARDFDRWTLNVTGTGIDSEVHLLGDNRYSGDTHVSGTTLVVHEDENLGGSDGTVILDEGGLGLADGFTLARDVLVNARGARFVVDEGTRASLAGNVTGDGGGELRGGGVLALESETGFDGDWNLVSGALEIDDDALLGDASITLAGGGIHFAGEVADVREISVDGGGFLQNQGHEVSLAGALDGEGSITYQGAGSFLVLEDNRDGDTFVQEGSLVGDIGWGRLGVSETAVYDLGGQNRTVQAVLGDGEVRLGDNSFTIHSDIPFEELDIAEPPLFEGTFTGDGLVVIRNMAIGFRGDNQHQGGTRVENGLLQIREDSHAGPAGVQLAGGTLDFGTSGETSLAIDLDGGGTIDGASHLGLNQAITGDGDLELVNGTFVLRAENTHTGDTIVRGPDSLLALEQGASPGDGTLVLSGFGGLQIRQDTDELIPLALSQGGGVIDVMDNDVTSSGGLTGMAPGDGLALEGQGSLTLTGPVDYDGLTDIRGGTLRFAGDDDTASVQGDIHIGSAGTLEINRGGDVSLGNRIEGEGRMLMTGSGVLAFTGDHYNLFTGGLRIEDGSVSFDGENLLGVGPVVLDGGELLFGSDLNTGLELDVGGGSLAVVSGEEHAMFADTFGAGDLEVTGAGTLVFAGFTGHEGETRVREGTLQIGRAQRGMLAGDVHVDAGATLAFGREDLVGYGGLIDGEGDVAVTGGGELVLTRDHLFQGSTRVESGTLRLGHGAEAGSVAGDIELFENTRVIFDRSDDPVHDGDISGQGQIVKSGSGMLTLLGRANHTGGTLVDNGVLRIGNGGEAGNLEGNVRVGGGSWLQFERSDDFATQADIQGAGGVVQSGTGTVKLAGDNSFSGNVLIRDGGLAVDANERLGQGELLLDGGRFVYGQAFNDLRQIRLSEGGGALDTDGHDVRYTRTISGEGPLAKTGAGSLVLTGNIVVDEVRINNGELRVGDDDNQGNLLADVFIDQHGTLAFGRDDIVSLVSRLEGSGRLLQDGDGLLFLGTDNPDFSGTTEIRRGGIRLDAALGGSMEVNGGVLSGSGSLGGDLRLGSGTLALGERIGSLTVGGDLGFQTDSRWELDVTEGGHADLLDVDGSAELAGTLRVLPGGGDFSNDMTVRILSASERIGQFDEVESNLVFLSPTLLYGADFVDLALTRSGTAFTQVSLTDNQLAVAGVLDDLEDGHPVTAHVLGQDISGARRAYDGFSGDTLLGGYMAGARSGRLFSSHLHQRNMRLGHASRGQVSDRLESALAALTEGATATFPMAHQLHAWSGQDGSPVRRLERIWIQGQQMHLEEKADSATGNPEFTVSGQMFSVGGDGYWGEDLILGAAVGHSSGAVRHDDREASGDLTGWHAGLYGRWDGRGNLHLAGALSWGETEVEQRRRMPHDNSSARSDADVTALNTTLEAGYAMHRGEYSLRPRVGLLLQRLERNGFTESGTDAALDVEQARHDYGEVSLGMDLSRPWLFGDTRWAQWQAGAALVRGFGDTRLEQRTAFTGTDPSFRTRGAVHDSLALDASVGAELHLTPEMALWGGYQGRLGDQRQEHSALISANLRW